MRCDSCRYGFQADVGEEGKMLTACIYILRAGERRPCPFGEGCTVYLPREKRDGPKGWFREDE